MPPVVSSRDITTLAIANEKETSELLFNISAGLIEDVISDRKYGANTDVQLGTTEYIRDGGGQTYNYLTTNQVCYVVSDDPLDTGAIYVYGLKEDADGDWNPHVVEVELNGLAPVSIGEFVRIFRMRNVVGKCPDGGVRASTLSVGQPTQDQTLAYMQLNAGSTQMAMTTVPSGYTMFIFRIYCSVSKGEDAEFTFGIRPYGCSVFFNMGLIGQYQTSNQYELGFEKAREKSDIRFVCSTNTVGTNARASFHYILVPNKYVKA